MSFYETISDLTLSNLTQSDSSFPQPLDFISESLCTDDNEANYSICDSSGTLNLPAMYRFNLLPKGFFIDLDKPSTLPLHLPESHKIVLHLSGRAGDLLSTYFLCMNCSLDVPSFYVIFVHSDGMDSGLQIMDGAHISAEDEPVVSSFLLEDRPGMECLPHPFSIELLQTLIDEQLPSLLYSKGIKSMQNLVGLLQCRRYDYCKIYRAYQPTV